MAATGQGGVETQGTIRSKSPNWQPWLAFFLRALAEQVQRLNRKVAREKIVLAAPELSLQIDEFAREHGRVTMGDAIRLTGGNRNTLKQHFRALVKQGRLKQRGAGRGAGMNDSCRQRRFPALKRGAISSPGTWAVPCRQR